MRVGVVSPLPPAPTGIADYTAELAAILAGRHEVELFHGQEAVDPSRLPAACPARPAAELVARHAARAFDVVVHQLGNHPAHAFQYDLLARVPGLLVLHDLVLFHARASAFLESETLRAFRADPSSAARRAAARPVLEAWREELARAYPRQSPRLYEAHLGTVGELLPYAYPLFRLPVEASRAVAVHDAWLVEAIRGEVKEPLVLTVPMPAQAVPVDPREARALRRRLGFSDEHLVVATFGLVTKEKRIGSIARAVAAGDPRWRLLVVGPVPDPAGLDALLLRAGACDRTVVTGRVPFDSLPHHAEAADVVAHLRYPTGRETSAALLRVLAQGRPTIVSDLAQQGDLPDDAVLRLDLAEEAEALGRALRAMADDPDLRRRLGRAAAAHVARAHGPQAVAAAWDEALERTRRRR